MNWVQILESWWNDFARSDQPLDSLKSHKVRDYTVDNVEVEISTPYGVNGAHTLNAVSNDKAMLVTYGYENVTALFGGDEDAHVVLSDVKNSIIRTHAGNDFIEVSAVQENKDKSSLQIFTHAGHDMVVLNSLFKTNVSYKVKTGEGNDRIISSGMSKEILDGGEGDDYFEPGSGNDVVIGGPGFDEVALPHNASEYEINDNGQGRIELTHGVDIKTLMDIELLSFKDTSIYLGNQFVNLNEGTYNPYNYISWFGVNVSTDNNLTSEKIVSFFELIKSFQAWKNDEDDDASLQASVLTDDATDNDTTLIVPEIEDIEVEAPIAVTEIDGEMIIGDRQHNYLSGSNEGDLILGNQGRDNLYGAGGDDILVGGAGRDFLEGGAGDDLLIGGTGRDTAYYWGFASEFSFDLETNTITDLLDDYGTDTLVSIERIVFWDATYKLSDTGIEKVGSHFWWYPQSGLNVTGEASNNVSSETSYQINIEQDDQIHNLTIAI